MSLDTKVGVFGVDDILSINENDSISLALYRMLHNRFRRLPVIDDDFNNVGIITAGDVVKKAHLEGTSDFIDDAVSSIMTKNMIYIQPEDTIYNSIIKLSDKRISGMPIIQDEVILVGMFSYQDIINNHVIWDDLPNSIIDIDYGIGRVIEQSDIATFDFSFWQGIDLMVKYDERELIIHHDQSFRVMTIFDFLKGFLSKLMLDMEPLSFIHSTPLRQLFNHSMMSFDPPVGIQEVVSLFQEKKLFSVYLQDDENRIKVIREIDLIKYIVEYIRFGTHKILQK